MNWNKYDEISNKREAARRTVDLLGNLYCFNTEYDREILLYAWKYAEAKMNKLNDEANALLHEDTMERVKHCETTDDPNLDIIGFKYGVEEEETK